METTKSSPRCTKSFRDTSGPPRRRLNPRKAQEKFTQLNNAAFKQATITIKPDLETRTAKSPYTADFNITPICSLFAALGGRSSSLNPCALHRIELLSFSSCTRAACTLYFNLGFHFDMQFLLGIPWAHVFLRLFLSDAPGFETGCTLLEVSHF